MASEHQLLEQIAAGHIAPVYLLCGERLPRERTAQAVREAVVGNEPSAFNFDMFRAGEASIDSVVGAVRTMPMIGGRRLVIVRGADQFGAKELNELVPYVDKPSPHCVLVLLADKGDARLKFSKTVAKKGVFARFEPLKPRGAPAWIAAEARRRGASIAPGVAERIAEAVGTDMAELLSALERLELYAGLGEQVTVGHVEELLATTRRRSIFELTNAVGRRQHREALLVLHEMIQGREPPLRIVAMLARHLRQLWTIRELAAANRSHKAIAAEVGVHPFFVKDMVRQAQSFDGPMFERTHRALYEADRALKSSPLPPPAILDRLVLELVS